MEGLDKFRINEGRTMQAKRKYGAHNSINVGVSAPIRNDVLRFIKSKSTVTRAELTQFIASLDKQIGGNQNATKWIKRNQKFLKEFRKDLVSHYKLTKLGLNVIKNGKLAEGFKDDIIDMEEFEDMIYDNGDMFDTAEWEKQVNDVFDGDDWEDMDEDELKGALGFAQMFMKKRRIKPKRR